MIEIGLKVGVVIVMVLVGIALIYVGTIDRIRWMGIIQIIMGVVLILTPIVFLLRAVNIM